jgi:hypothetical protein
MDQKNHHDGSLRRGGMRFMVGWDGNYHKTRFASNSTTPAIVILSNFCKYKKITKKRFKNSSKINKKYEFNQKT